MLSSLFAPFLLGLLTAWVAGWFLIPVLRKLKAGQSISADAPKSRKSFYSSPLSAGVNRRSTDAADGRAVGACGR